MKQSASIFIESLELYAHHGWYDHEKTFGHHFILDLTLTFDIQEARTKDHLTSTIDYTAVITAVRRLFCDQRYHLLEAAAMAVGEGLLAEFSRIESLSLSVRKPRPPASERVGATGIALTFER